VELESLEVELQAVDPLLRKLEVGVPDAIELRAVATTLHAFYTGVERVLVQIAKRVDRTLPTGTSWHRELLQQMASAADQRPAVVHEALLHRLSEYLGFRHFYRYAYPTTLRWERMEPLVRILEQTFREFQSAIRRFLSMQTPTE
jgi:hypothetical protein